MRIKLPAALLTAAVLATACSSSSELPPRVYPAPTVTVTETVTPKAARTKAAPTPRPTRTTPTITDGTWTVGDDIPAGRYKVTAPVVEGCYWKITKSGTNGLDIIQNDLPSGGLPRVTITAGQDFETEDCGVWAKQP